VSPPHPAVPLLQSLSRAHRATALHGVRVARYAEAIAIHLDISDADRDALRTACLLHDVGKADVPRQVLEKPGALSASERMAMIGHVAAGGVRLDGIVGLERARALLLLHHERPDGQGYPRRLTAAQLPRAARVLSVADAFDAMTSTRPYRRALEPAEALRELRRIAGKQLDGDAVEALLPRAEALFASRLLQRLLGGGGAARAGGDRGDLGAHLGAPLEGGTLLHDQRRGLDGPEDPRR
jgi:putative nucleotidyltransferase with HDIG domain